MTLSKEAAIEQLLGTHQKYWLMKTEPGECSIDDVLQAPEQSVSWFGIRNYQARNFMRDEMQVGDGVLFYHSSCAKPGIVGLATIASTPYPDELQFDPKSEYYDPKSSPENPRWLTIQVKALWKAPEVIALSTLKADPHLSNLLILRKGNRLSITPVQAQDFTYILQHLL